jgi:CubicO group peptidase (beta-lactamase class C family)
LVSLGGFRCTLLAILFAVVGFSAPSDAAALDASDLSFPGKIWERTTPAKVGWAIDVMQQAQAYCERIGTASFVVVQHGKVIESGGDIAQRLELHSVRKSLLNSLIGIAVNEDRIHLTDTLAKLGIDDVAPSLSESEKQATVQQLLQARSGVYHVSLYETNGERRMRPERGSHAPGAFWYYNNWDFNTLGAIYEHAVDTSIFQSFKTRIADPIGMEDYRPSDGRYVTGPESNHRAYPFQMSARDLARFGLLFLNQGRWRSKQIVPSSWVKESATAWSESYLHSGYGYLWWTGYPDKWVAVMDLPPGGFWADGAEGQFIVVDPADDLVVVHQTNGEKVSNRQMGHLMWLILKAAHSPNPGMDPDPAEN